MTTHWIAAPITIALIVTSLSPSRRQSRDAARPSSGSASLSGIVVTDESGGRPVRRATVTLAISGDPRSSRIVASDDDGRFEFVGLPAGNFTLSASKPGYVTTYYGAKRPGSNVGVPIAIAEGQQTPTITVRLLRGAVITGTVRDDRGRAVPFVSVRPQRVVTTRTGQRTFMAAAVDRFSSDSTDDRGVYRIFGLPPGDYVVLAQPRLPGALIIGEPSGELRQSTTAELQWAEQQTRGATSTGPAAGVPPAPAASVALANVYHPGVVDAGAAGLVSVVAGQERSGVDVRLQLVPTARVSGRLLDADGQPAAGVPLILVPRAGTVPVLNVLTALEVGLIAGTNARSAADGTFTFLGVQPAPYTVVARPALGRGGSTAAVPGLWAATEIDVSGRDIEGLALALLPGMSVAGRVAFEGAAAPVEGRVTVRLMPTQLSGIVASGIAQTASGEMPFVVPNVVPGAYRVATTLAAGSTPWVLNSATLSGRDVADLPFDVRPQENVAGLVVTFVPAAQLTGTLLDHAGRPTSDLSIILFATDRNLWFQGSRRLRSPVRPASNGRFSFGGLPAGEYYLAALADYEPTDWYDPDFLDQVAPGAIKITLTSGEQKTQDLKLAGGR